MKKPTLQMLEKAQAAALAAEAAGYFATAQAMRDIASQLIRESNANAGRASVQCTDHVRKQHTKVISRIQPETDFTSRFC